MPELGPVPMHVVYRPKKGKEKELEALVRGHWPVLQKAGLVTKEPARVWRASDKRSGAVFFVEMFSWKDGGASDAAHRTPEVMAVWGPMEPILEKIELARLDPLDGARGLDGKGEEE